MVHSNSKYFLGLLSNNQTWKFGDPNHFTRCWKGSFSVKVDPGKTVRIASTVTRAKLEVPYAMVLRSTVSGTLEEVKGLWSGIVVWDFRHTTTTVN